MAVLDSNEIFFTAFEPKVQNRAVLYVDGIPSFMIHKFAAPTFKQDAKKIEHINTYFNIAGKRRWNDIQLSLYDPVTPSGAQAVMDWCRLQYEAVTGRAGYQDFYKKDAVIDVLGPVGDVVSEWILKGAWISDASKFADFDWGNEGEAVDIDIKLTYDYAVLNY